MDERELDPTPLPEGFIQDMEIAGRTGPDEAARRKIIAGLGPLLPGGGGGGEPASVPATGPGTSAPWVAAAAALALLVGATSIGVWLFAPRTEDPRPSPVTVEEPAEATPSRAVEAAPEPETAGRDVESVEAPLEPSVRAENGVASRAEPPGEIELLDAARGALARNPRRSLGYLRRHATLYRDGVFEEEREVLAVEVLLRLGRTARAQARAARFSAAHPSSAHRPRLEQLLAESANP